MRVLTDVILGLMQDATDEVFGVVIAILNGDLTPKSIANIERAVDGEGELVLERPVCADCPKAMLGPMRWSCGKAYDKTCEQATGEGESCPFCEGSGEVVSEHWFIPETRWDREKGKWVERCSACKGTGVEEKGGGE